jgi:hypothetical protein
MMNKIFTKLQVVIDDAVEQVKEKGPKAVIDDVVEQVKKKAVKRMLAVVDGDVDGAPWPPPFPRPEKKGTCDGCAHFDLEEGQAVLAQHRTFGLVTEHVSPSMMSSEAMFDAQGSPLYEEDGSRKRDVASVPHKTKWSDFGACDHHQECRLRTDVCDGFEPKPQES